MKAIKLAAVFCILASGLLFTSCTRDADYSSTTREIISKGQWTIDYFYAGQDRTAQFSHYTFTFQGNGVVTGGSSTVSFAGSWSMIRDVERNDVILMNISGQEPQLSALSRTWSVRAKSSNALTMKDDENNEIRFRKL
ncbi:MAG TPA: hypothetical protein VFR58_03710 [Flavisolibacter sp.]|nr:hypothetical protein [Flavisolibacter sp.]